ncbi:hypothetical protein N4E86_000982 [Salmonella enterica]|nr:hypothetical protein [Salmonella enterica subsp. enterica serovar Lagos]EJU0544305.1 hypothetical protein [Salmonella enterica]
MNDITALALIAKIKKQTESFDTVVLQEGEANALVEALERAQRQIVNFQQSCENDPRIHEIIDLKERIAELDQRLIEYAGIATREARRVAELEARTVTVKLYDDFQLCHYGTTEDYAKGYIDSQNNFTKWLSAAGIKVKES